MSQWFLSDSLYCQFLFHFCAFLSQLPELEWNLAEEINLQLASKRFPSFGPPANSNKNDAKKSQFCPNWNWTGTIYHWSVILRSFSVVLTSANREANGFFKVLLISLHLLISWHPVQKSKFGACAVTGHCSFKKGLRDLKGLGSSLERGHDNHQELFWRLRQKITIPPAIEQLGRTNTQPFCLKSQQPPISNGNNWSQTTFAGT